MNIFVWVAQNDLRVSIKCNWDKNVDRAIQKRGSLIDKIIFKMLQSDAV